LDANEAVVLLVEDDADDAKLITRALKKTTLPARVEVARSGGEAVAYICGAPPFDNRARFPLPVLVILDLKMPGVDGYEVLKMIRAGRALHDVPVVVLTAVRDAFSVSRTYELGASVYFVKPAAGRGFAEVVREIENYWLASQEEGEE